MAFVACLLCAGIFYLTIDSPQSSRLNADDISQKKADIRATEQMARDLMEALKNQQALNQKLTEADSRTIEVVDNLQSSIARLSEHVKDSVPTREEVTKLVSAKTSEAIDSGECTCGEKLADLQKQIDDLKAKVATLETQCASTSSKASTAAAASSYGTVSAPVVASSGGSTGSSVKSGGSTGSAVRTSSGGSTGSLPYGHSYYTDPSTGLLMYCYRDPMEELYARSTAQYSQPVVSSPVVVSETVTTVSGDGCYVDANGNTVCPQRSAATTQSRPLGLMPRLRNRFSN